VAGARFGSGWHFDEGKTPGGKEGPERQGERTLKTGFGVYTCVRIFLYRLYVCN